MKALFNLAFEINTYFEKQNWKFCFIGGIALQRWGRPRLTTDIDISIFTGFGDEEFFIDQLIKFMEPRISDAKSFALENRVLLLKSSENIGIDIALSGFPFEENIINRATPFEFIKDQPIQTCSAEDLIVLKSFAERGQDWVDVEGIVIRQKALDWSYILKHLKPLCELKERPQILQRLEAIKNEYTNL